MLHKEKRLRKSREIKSAIKEKEIEVRGPLLCLLAKKNKLKESRILIIPSRKIKGSVKRNLIRRKISAAYQTIWHKIKKNHDFIIFPKEGAKTASVKYLASEMEILMKRAGVY